MLTASICGDRSRLVLLARRPLRAAAAAARDRPRTSGFSPPAGGLCACTASLNESKTGAKNRASKYQVAQYLLGHCATNKVAKIVSIRLLLIPIPRPGADHYGCGGASVHGKRQ